MWWVIVNVLKAIINSIGKAEENSIAKEDIKVTKNATILS